jgi:hypothetical protein
MSSREEVSAIMADIAFRYSYRMSHPKQTITVTSSDRRMREPPRTDGRRRPLTEAHRKKLSAAKQGNRNAAGTRSLEQRAKISASLMGNKNALGHKWTPESKAHHAAAMARPETKAKLSAIHKGKPWSAARWAAQEKLRQNRNK